jgi:hypothetical protein
MDLEIIFRGLCLGWYAARVLFAQLMETWQNSDVFWLIHHPQYWTFDVILRAVGLSSGYGSRLAWTFLPRTLSLLYDVFIEGQTLRDAFAEQYATHWKMTKRILSRLCVFVICAGLGSRSVAAQDHVGNMLSGKATIQILYRSEEPQMLPKPDRVIIQDFVNNGPVVVDERARSHFHKPDSSTIPDELVRQLQKSFAKTLIGQIKKMKVEPKSMPDASTVVGPALIVEGEFTSIAPGNARRRIIVGFGRGASDLRTHIIISEVVESQKIVLLECNIDSRSGRQPGAILTTSGTGFAAGVATGYFGDKMSSTVQADASRMAKLVGKEIKAIMVAQRWIGDYREGRST